MSDTRWRIERATAGDEAALGHLLAQEALPGWVRLAHAREPSLGAGLAREGERHDVVVARATDGGRVLAMFTRSVRRVWLRGQPHRIGYLGQFRVDPELARGPDRVRLLRDGFRFAREVLRRGDELPLDLTAVTADNRGALRLLTAGVRGLPRYVRFADLTTLAIATRAPGRRATVACPSSARDWPAICGVLAQHRAGHRLAPVWDATALARAGLAASDFLVVGGAAGQRAVAALWDQRAYKQTLVRGYRADVRLARRAWNATAARALGLPPLPPVGQALAQAWLAPVAAHDDGAAEALIDAALATARARGLDQVLVGGWSGDPLLVRLRATRRHIAVASTAYLVEWEPGAADLVRWAPGPPAVEVATL
ncbi:MAG: hypothetical protein H6983_13910 [Ectothiorhodospiraceae bacterium]|nr:hypothetical protein [Ectothiorhodospiraceae bacterium]